MGMFRTYGWLVLSILLGGAAFWIASADTSDVANQASCLGASAIQPVDVRGGSFIMGSDNTYPEEAPARRVAVSPFSLDATEVTNDQFAAFVDATGYVTTAERAPDPSLVPKGAPEDFFKAGAAVFQQPDNPRQNWWNYVPGANWKNPEGPESSIDGKGDHPVVQVSYHDALAYAEWTGRRLPSEEEWEYAARADRPSTTFAWGDAPPPDGPSRANTWQGLFPVSNTETDGYARTAPVGCFAGNPFGLYDMMGNVWEWTATSYAQSASPVAEPVMTLKGGSFLCADNFCIRYRPPARQGQEAGLPTNHIGFRTAADATD